MMTRTLLATFFAVVLLACGGPESDLEGNWVLDESAMDAEMEKNNVPKGARGMTLAMLKGTRMSFKDGKADMVMAKFSYEVVKTDGDKITLKATDGMAKGTEQTLEVDGDTLIMQRGGTRLFFKRAD